MRPVTTAFLSSLRGSHSACFRARVCPPGRSGTDPDGTEIDVVDGSVTLDATAKIRGVLDLSVVDKMPTGPTDLLAPYGNEIYVERGIRRPDGTSEWVGLGYYRINAVGQQGYRSAIRLAGQDRMCWLDEARMTAPRQFLKTTTPNNIINALVHDIIPWATIDVDDPALFDQSLGRSLVAEQDRLGFLQDLVTSYAKDWHWDHLGSLVIANAPDPTASVWDVDAGANGVLVDLDKELSRDGVYNAVVARGEASDDKPPVTAIARDMNPASPTYWFGGFGKVPEFYESQFLVTLNQCKDAARSLLVKNLGLPYSLDFQSVPNPALEALDPVRVVEPGANPAQVHVIQTLTIPLSIDQAMTATTKELTNVSVDVEELT